MPLAIRRCKPAFQSESFIVICTVGNALVSRICGSFVKPGLHVRRKHKNKHKHKHKDVYTCDLHKHNVTYASAEANKFGAIARPGCLLARDLIPTWRKMATHE